jgi:REP element-mobilizing transposase RayT
MSRPPRILFHGALYHVTTRGNRRASIYADDEDHVEWQNQLASVVERCNVGVHAFCQMPNHFHLLIETPDANLPVAMHLLNSNYARHYNERHGLTGHVTQGRYHAVLVERDEQLLQTARYIALNPVRAALTRLPEDWPWSSHRALSGQAPMPAWLKTDTVLGHFGGSSMIENTARYAAFVAADDANKHTLAAHQDNKNTQVRGRRFPVPLEIYRRTAATEALAMALAFASGFYTRAEIARHFKVATRTVSRAIATFRLRRG